MKLGRYKKNYAIDLPKKFKMFSLHMVGTPMNINKKLQLEDGAEGTN